MWLAKGGVATEWRVVRNGVRVVVTTLSVDLTLWSTAAPDRTGGEAKHNQLLDMSKIIRGDLYAESVCACVCMVCPLYGAMWNGLFWSVFTPYKPRPSVKEGIWRHARSMTVKNGETCGTPMNANTLMCDMCVYVREGGREVDSSNQSSPLGIHTEMHRSRDSLFQCTLFNFKKTCDGAALAYFHLKGQKSEPFLSESAAYCAVVLVISHYSTVFLLVTLSTLCMIWKISENSNKKYVFIKDDLDNIIVRLW